MVGAKKITCLIGTRPEAIKMAPVIHALQESPLVLEVLCSGQHRELLTPLLEWFGITPDGDLQVMQQNQALTQLTSRLLQEFQNYLTVAKPDMVVAQGDTTTVMSAALCCFYNHIPFAHVEAGLRTFDLHNPFPEEFNRLTAGRLAALHFCPTPRAAQNLLAEGAAPHTVHVTGNTVIDALHFTIAKLPQQETPPRRQILLTAHRRENFGTPLQNIFRAVLQLCAEFPDLNVIYPVHPNPNVMEAAYTLLHRHPQITLTAPLNYPDLVQAMRHSLFILTDSGGIQEEAPALGKPVVVLRNETERPEAIELGVAKLAGADGEKILAICRSLLNDPDYYQRMACGGSPYGDGHAAQHIKQLILRTL